MNFLNLQRMWNKTKPKGIHTNDIGMENLKTLKNHY